MEKERRKCILHGDKGREEVKEGDSKGVNIGIDGINEDENGR